MVCTISSSLVFTCYAHPQASEHNNELESVLFEPGYSKYQSDEIKNSINALENASYLTIDQFGDSGEEQFNALKDLDMGGLPSDFSDIAYNEDPTGSGLKIGPNNHRKYTHQGWDREYEVKGAKKFWKARRNVLLGTVNSVFGFGKLTALFGYNDKCNSMAGIIYYVHLLGDYDEADNYQKISLLTDLAGHEDTDQNDMICALKQYIEILFEDQSSADDYDKLMKELDEYAETAGAIVQSVGGVNTDEEFEEYHKCANDIMDSLIKHLPVLLKQEEFFSSVFYPTIN